MYLSEASRSVNREADFSPRHRPVVRRNNDWTLKEHEVVVCSGRMSEPLGGVFLIERYARYGALPASAISPPNDTSGQQPRIASWQLPIIAERPLRRRWV